MRKAFIRTLRIFGPHQLRFSGQRHLILKWKIRAHKGVYHMLPHRHTHWAPLETVQDPRADAGGCNAVVTCARLAPSTGTPLVSGAASAKGIRALRHAKYRSFASGMTPGHRPYRTTTDNNIATPLSAAARRSGSACKQTCAA